MSDKPSVDPTKVTGRRELRYETFDELLADAEQQAGAETVALGNWSKGQIFRHLAMAIDTMIDGPPFKLWAPVRWLLAFFLKKRMMARTLDPGFKLPKSASAFLPPETSPQEGLELLRKAIQRIKATDDRAMHGGLGYLTKEEWDAFQLRHCEMHMSFIVPKND
ncbi:MAG: DUF1569 domain-containing protein [Planctomycetaceae bacterium]